MANKKKIVLLSDHPLVPSGVGTQSKYLIEGLLATGKYKFVCLGGAIKHNDYKPQKICSEKYGEDWIIYPVDGYGNKEFLRNILYSEKPDAVLLFTDPRFFVWVWEMEDEIRSVCPLFYWHVWDNDPAPKFNNIFYRSTDAVAALSLKTFGLLHSLEYENRHYIPHSLDENIFKLLPEEEVMRFKKDHFGPHADKKFILFWNNRNARRKQTGDVIAIFSKFADIVGRDKVSLMMHTMIGDQEGQNIVALADEFNVQRQLIISEERVVPDVLNSFYNVVDTTINIASNEGFGLSTLESLYAGTPIIVHFTGGLQFQIGDWWQELSDFRDQDKMTNLAKNKFRKNVGSWWGIPLFPASRSCTGSQQIPYIYDDRVCHEDGVKALLKMYEMGRKKRRELGEIARKWAMEKFNFQEMISSWDNLFEKQIEKFKTTNSSIRIAHI
jgi:glycosyltransferase involved in cell wall biosynthesis